MRAWKFSECLDDGCWSSSRHIGAKKSTETEDGWPIGRRTSARLFQRPKLEAKRCGMPFYQCIAPIGVITADMKQEIVDEITRIHCEATGGLPRFVQIQFDEEKPENAFQERNS